MACLRTVSGPGEPSPPLALRDVNRLGRSNENDLVIRDALASRFHATVVRREDGWWIRDLASSSGTMLNGERVKQEARLADQDVVMVGQTRLVFDGRESPAPAAATGLENDDAAAVLGGETIRLTSSIHDRQARNLSAARNEKLLQVAAAIRSVCGLDDLLGKLLDAIVAVFQPDRSAILLSDPLDGKLEPKVGRPAGPPVQVSRTIVTHALQNEVALLVADPRGDARFAEIASIREMSIRAAICVPLVSKGRVLGVLYMDTLVDLMSYQEQDLALLNLIAANAAIAIENALLIEEGRASFLPGSDLGEVVAESAAMRRVRDRLPELASGGGPLLLDGEPGTGKFFLAKRLHRDGPHPEAPFVAVDCRTFRRGEQAEAIFGTAPRTDFARPSADATGTSTRGALHAAHQGTLVLRHVGDLEPSAQKALHAYLEAARRGEVHPRARIVATTSEPLEPMVRVERMHPPLANALSPHALAVPPLRERREDIVPLARHFLAVRDRSGGDVAGVLGRSAEHALKKNAYRENNVAELRAAVEFAARIADGPTVGAEHIFTGPVEGGGKLEVDLTRSEGLYRWLRSRWLAAVPLAVLGSFATIAAVCVAAGESTAGRIANHLVWGLWWPGLLVLFLAVGRLWCPACPLSAASRIAKRIGQLGRKPPEWLKQHGGKLTAVLLLAILWSEHVFHMPESPLATGIFLATLGGLAVAFGVVYEREVWCRWLCPLGSLAAGYSVPAIVQIHSTQSICATECKTQDCFKGNADEPGCPVFLHPLYVKDAHFCKLCGHCLRSCRHQSARPYLRPHLQEIWTRGELSPTLLPFSLLTLLLVPVLLAARVSPWIASAAGFSALGLGALALALALSRALPRMLTREPDPTTAARVAFALLLLAWGPFLAFHLGHVPELESVLVQPAPGSFLAEHLPPTALSLRTVLQLLAIAAGTAFAGVAWIGIRGDLARKEVALRPIGWILLQSAALIYAAVSAWLVL